jgi:cysteine-rich repeat protein/parallel beta-helix repeat protein
MARFALAGCVAALSPAAASELVVAGSGGDFVSIQAALDQAVAGDTVTVREKATPYFEALVFRTGGSVAAGPLVLRAAPGEHPVIDGSGVSKRDLIRIDSQSRVRIEGLTLRNLAGVTDASAIRFVGSGSQIEIRNNHIHGLRGKNAMAITFYGTEPTAISDVVIDGNLVHDVQAAPSEVITLNGNVSGFAVTNNVVRDVNNIGIDAIGGEQDIQSNPTLVARNGVIRGNRVERARSSYGGGFAAGIYVDGGRDIVVENNTVRESDVGIEIGAENPGIVTRNVVVRNNLVARNEKAGIGFGGYAANRGRVENSRFEHNTVFENDTLGRGFGELWIQYGTGNVVTHNVFVALAGRTLLNADLAEPSNTIDWNLWWSPDAGAARFRWGGALLIGFDAWRAASGRDANGRLAAPLFVAAPSDLHLAAGSPAIDAGSPGFSSDPAERDLDAGVRQSGLRTDSGADEFTRCGDALTEAPESCDDGNLVSGDGCDANCTPTGCGNGILTPGETCDDANAVAGDCCSAVCALELDGSACSDADACTQEDACVAGACVGDVAPATGCVSLATSRVVLDPTPGTLTWTARGASALALLDLGDAVAGSTEWKLCVYDSNAAGARLLAGLRLPAGGFCNSSPCWKTSAGKKLSYTDRFATPDGVSSLVITTGTSRGLQVSARAKSGVFAAPGMLPLAQNPDLAVQLLASNGLCIESRLEPPALRNDATVFSDQK